MRLAVTYGRRHLLGCLAVYENATEDRSLCRVLQPVDCPADLPLLFLEAVSIFAHCFQQAGISSPLLADDLFIFPGLFFQLCVTRKPGLYIFHALASISPASASGMMYTTTPWDLS